MWQASGARCESWVCFGAGGRNEFGTVQNVTGDDITVAVRGNLPTTLFTETTKRISAGSIRDVITELV